VAVKDRPLARTVATDYVALPVVYFTVLAVRVTKLPDVCVTIVQLGKANVSLGAALSFVCRR
jgi:hypothetical protein